MSAYSPLIERLAPGANARWVEAWMQLKHATLDDLSADRFRHEVHVAIEIIAAATAERSEQLAQSFGL